MSIWSGDLDDKLDAVGGGRSQPAARKAVKPTVDLTRVPRPLAVARPGKIDLSTAPSSMELAAKRWSGR